MPATTKTSPRRRSFFRSRRFIAIGVIVVILIAAVVAMRTIGNRPPPAPATIPVTRGPITASVNGIGTTAAARTVDLGFQATGIIKEILVAQGDTVSAGQPLARLDDQALQAQVT